MLICFFTLGALLKEGTICLLIIAPLVLGVALVGVFLFYIIDKITDKFDSKDNSIRFYSIALLLPFLVAPIETELPPFSKKVVTS